MHQISEYRSQTGERVFWNPSLFSGMPIYHRSNPEALGIDSLILWMGKHSSKVFLFYILGALGMFLLLRYYKVRPLVAFLATLMFILWPHMKALWLEGHLAKLQSLMYLPWVLLSFSYFRDKRTAFSAALFALAFGMLIRTEHYQIIFYGGLLVFALGVYPFIRLLVEKKYTEFIKGTALLVLALVLGIMTAAQPMFLAKEYLPYSKRGKTTLDLKQVTEGEQGTGVSAEYAMQWSTHPSEILTWMVPRFAGGMSGEEYHGDRYPRLDGQTVPGYWGHMPFTQSYEYMGLLLLILALTGILLARDRVTVWSLGIFALFMIFLSFGRHFPSLYTAMFDHVPYFNKFRSPMMGVTVTFQVFVILAALGLERLAGLAKDADFAPMARKRTYIAVGVVVGMAIFLLMFGGSDGFLGELTGKEAFTKSGENYSPDEMRMIADIRQEMLVDDLKRTALLALISGALVLLVLKPAYRKYALPVMAVVILADVYPVSSRMKKNFIDPERFERQSFARTDVDDFLLNDPDHFRIFPVGKLLQDNRWAYYHQTIGGYSPAKMVAIEEIIQNSLYAGWESNFPVNWNVLKMLNVKYLVSEGMIGHPGLRPVHQSRQTGMVVSEYLDYKPRAFFVNDYRIVDDPVERLKLINSPEIDLAASAILEKEPAVSISAPDSSHVKVLAHNPNRLELEAYTDATSLLVFSEQYYPPGWKLWVDGELVPEDEVLRADHTLQATVVGAGTHNVVLDFHPDRYFKYVRMAWIALGIIYLVIIAGLLMHFNLIPSRAGAKQAGETEVGE